MSNNNKSTITSTTEVAPNGYWQDNSGLTWITNAVNDLLNVGVWSEDYVRVTVSVTVERASDEQ